MPKIQLKPLKGKKRFDELFKKGIRFKGNDCMAVVKPISLSVIPDSECVETGNPITPLIIFPTGSGIRFRTIFFAVSISKKNAKKAVVRNRVKRLMRESLRQLLSEKAFLFEKIEEIALIWRNAPDNPKFINLNDVKPAVAKLMMNISNFSFKNN
jgi:ribonuclease P protein component